MHLRSRAEYAGVRIRPTALATSTMRSRPSGWAIAGPSSTSTASITGSRARASARSARDADLFVNLSGGSWFWRDEYVKIPRRVFIDSDPVFTQLAIAKAEGWYVDFFKGFDHLFTFGANIGTPGKRHPDWRLHVAQDLAARGHRAVAERCAARARSLHDGDDVEDRKLQQMSMATRTTSSSKFIDLPRRTSAPLRAGGQRPPAPAARARLGHGERDGRVEIALGLPHLHPGLARRVRGGQARLRGQLFGLVQRPDRVLPRRRPSGTGAGYRLERPSADGRRPVAVLELRRGARGLDRIVGDWTMHSKRAAEIAREHFDAGAVLPRFLEVACS